MHLETSQAWLLRRSFGRRDRKSDTVFPNSMLNLLQIPTTEIISLLAAISFAAGLNLYGTLAVLGLMARFGHPAAGLQVLEGWPVIVASLVCSELNSSPTRSPRST